MNSIVLVNKSKQRLIIYFLLTVGLMFCFFLLKDIPWHSDAQFHTLLEAVATFLAFMVGVVALVRYYSRPTNSFLFIGTAFLGTAFLDGYHTVITSTWMQPFAASLPDTLIPWSWVASRIFLAIMLYVGFLATQYEEKMGEKGRFNPQIVFFAVASFTLASFLFFILVPLPQAYIAE